MPVSNKTINSFSFLVFFLIITSFLYGCGDDPDDKKGRQKPGQPTDPPALKEEESSNPLIDTHNRQRALLLEKYNKILKPNAPLPVKIYESICTKENNSINIIVNEYTEDLAPGNGNELLCDFLQNEKVMRFATVEKNHCKEKADEAIEKLKVEGYSCHPTAPQQ